MALYLRQLVKSLLVASVLWTAAQGAAYADGSDQSYLVIGVIASAQPKQGVALLKAMRGGEAFAVRVGQEFAHDVAVEEITRDFVYLSVHGRQQKVRVGEQLDMASVQNDGSGSMYDAAGTGIERSGNVVRISSAFREHIIKRQLSQVLMQAAAVPYYVNGELQGFRLQDIDQGSIYEKAGFSDGDIVTAINGQRLTDVGMTVRMLHTLREDTKAEVTLIRSGSEQMLQLVVQ